MKLTLRDARDRRGWTQEQLEAASGVDQSLISKLERGANANPTYDTVQKLEAALRVSPGTLVFGQEAADAATPPTPDEPSSEPTDLTTDAVRSGR